MAVAPALLVSHPTFNARQLAIQWKVLYDKGIKLIAPSVTSSALIFAYLSWSAGSPTRRGSSPFAHPRNWYGAAALAVLSIGPFTSLVMGNNITQLSNAAKVAELGKENVGPVVELVSQWSRLNFVRAGLPMLSVVFGVFGIGCSQ